MGLSLHSLCSDPLILHRALAGSLGQTLLQRKLEGSKDDFLVSSISICPPLRASHSTWKKWHFDDGVLTEKPQSYWTQILTLFDMDVVSSAFLK